MPNDLFLLACNVEMLPVTILVDCSEVCRMNLILAYINLI